MPIISVIKVHRPSDKYNDKKVYFQGMSCAVLMSTRAVISMCMTLTAILTIDEVRTHGHELCRVSGNGHGHSALHTMSR